MYFPYCNETLFFVIRKFAIAKGEHKHIHKNPSSLACPNAWCSISRVLGK